MIERRGWWRVRPAIQGAALMFVAMIALGGGAGDQSRLMGVLHQAAAPARTEGEAVALTADLAGRLRGYSTIAALDSAAVLVTLAANGPNELIVDSDGIGAISTTTFATDGGDWQAVAATPGLRYHGISLDEGAAAAAVVRVFNGTDNTGAILETVRLLASTSASTFYERGIAATAGIFVESTTGTGVTRVSVRRRVVAD